MIHNCTSTSKKISYDTNFDNERCYIYKYFPNYLLFNTSFSFDPYFEFQD